MFITLEGIEGAGKTTLLHRLAAVLQAQENEVLLTREPGDSGPGWVLRNLLLNPETRLCPEAELFLFLADRAQHVTETIVPALQRGAIVLCDRYLDSTIVYQGYGRGLDIDMLANLNSLAIQDVWPDLTFVLDMDPAIALERARKRNQEQATAQKEGRFEAEALLFHQKIRQGFQEWTARHPGRIKLLDASDTPEGLLRQAIDHLATYRKGA